MERTYREMSLGRVALLATLAATVLLFAASMPLPWHHRVFQGSTAFVVVHGIEGDNWLIAMALIALVVLVRVVRDQVGAYTRWLMNLASLALLIGMFADYIDWQSRAVQRQQTALDYVPSYWGPGFYLALAGTALFIVANVLLWRVEA